MAVLKKIDLKNRTLSDVFKNKEVKHYFLNSPTFEFRTSQDVPQ